MASITKNDRLYLSHILYAMTLIERFTQGQTLKSFLADELLFSGVARQLEIIGEACNKLSPEFKEEFAFIPWSKIVGMRNILIHDYMGVDKEIIWDTSQNDLPEFKKQIEEII